MYVHIYEYICNLCVGVEPVWWAGSDCTYNYTVYTIQLSLPISGLDTWASGLGGIGLQQGFLRQGGRRSQQGGSVLSFILKRDRVSIRGRVLSYNRFPINCSNLAKKLKVFWTLYINWQVAENHRLKKKVKKTQQTVYFPGLGKHSFQKNATCSCSFTFFSKERNILAFFCVLYKKNAAFFAFFYVLYKRMRRSLRSFTFFIKECGVLCVLLRSL